MERIFNKRLCIAQLLLIFATPVVWSKNMLCADNEYTIHVSNSMQDVQRICIEIGSPVSGVETKHYFDIAPGGYNTVCVPQMDRGHAHGQLTMSAFAVPYHQRDVGNVQYTFDPHHHELKPIAYIHITSDKAIPPYF